MPDIPDLNEQISDIIGKAQGASSDDSANDIRSISYQLMTHAAGLAMFNAVFQQQQMYILQNAVTTATAKAIFDSKPEDALKIFNDAYRNNDILNTLSGLKEFIDGLNETYKDLNKKTAKPDEEKK
jgi:hypothetical protein